QGNTPVLVLLRHADDEAQVGTDKPLHRLLVTRLRTPTKFDLLLRRDQLVPADLAQVLVERGTLLRRPSKLPHAPRVGRTPPPLTRFPCFRRGGHETPSQSSAILAPHRPGSRRRTRLDSDARILPTKVPVPR